MTGTTSKRAKIYISGVHEEFKEYKQALVTLLESLGHQVFVQTKFFPGEGSLLEKLESLIREECDACIFLVGNHYGEEPGQEDAHLVAVDDGRRYSYAQWEYVFATQHQVPRFVFFPAPNTMSAKPEETAFSSLQQKFIAETIVDKWPSRSYFYSVYDLISKVRSLKFAAKDKRALPDARPQGSLNQLETGKEQQPAETSESPAEEAPKPPEYPPEQVQFTAYRPKQLVAGAWTPFLVFAHLEDRPPGSPEDALSPIEEVRKQAERLLGDSASAYLDKTKDSRFEIPREAEITLRPEVPGVRFNPPVRSFFWTKGVEVHREEFTILAEPDKVGRVLSGNLTIFLGSLILADIRLDFPIVAQALSRPSEADLTSAPATPYRRVFPSYSRLDLPVVEQIEQYSKTLGDGYLRDLVTLRPGEKWNPRLMELISQADVFQLFWSSNSARSKVVEEEWRYASQLKRPFFIRPTYWEEPIPKPPEELASLHFQKLWIRPFADAKETGQASKPKPEVKTAAVSLKTDTTGITSRSESGDSDDEEGISDRERDKRPDQRTAAVSLKTETTTTPREDDTKPVEPKKKSPPPRPPKQPPPSPAPRPGSPAGSPIFRPKPEDIAAGGRSKGIAPLLLGLVLLIALLILAIYFFSK